MGFTRLFRYFLFTFQLFVVRKQSLIHLTTLEGSLEHESQAPTYTYTKLQKQPGRDKTKIGFEATNIP